nr:tRNA lysidine(34) synthetase TilS [Saccharopolyspora sp. HNM0983]
MTATRGAVRRLLGSVITGDAVAVACSGGPDSLALAAAAAHVGLRRGLQVHGLVVDHGLQAQSAEVAQRTAEQLSGLGLRSQVLPVQVSGPGGPEAAARRARYAALGSARPAGAPVLLGHTLDDQAETVLLGLGRGSGARSLRGMAESDPPWVRPFLGVRRETTEQACRELGLPPWHDPHNVDPTFTRVRLRTEVLPLLEDVLGGGAGASLARTADQLREDSAVLDGFAAEVRERVEAAGGLDAAALAEAPAAIRRRVLRSWLLDRGVPELSDAHLRAADDLVGSWRGQGGRALPGDFVLRREHGTLLVEAAGRKPPNG